MIAFIGSVFSPYYARARRRGGADPEHHVAVNAILYTPGRKYWAMTERGRGALSRARNHLAVGPSSLRAEPGRLTIDIAERTVPVPWRLTGRVTVALGPVFDKVHALDPAGRHLWRPLAPCARAEVAFEGPGVSWSGKAYVDVNAGAEPLEEGFRFWTWSRAQGEAATDILYDVEHRGGGGLGLALRYGADGTLASFDPPPPAALPTTGWRVRRATRSDAGLGGRVVRTLEDTPFYSRSVVAAMQGGALRHAMHESVDLDRFRSRWVQMLLPFKMPRRA